MIFKTTAAPNQLQKPSTSQVKHKNINILDDQFPVEIIKTQDLRPQKDGLGDTVVREKKTLDVPSFHDSLND